MAVLFTRLDAVSTQSIALVGLRCRARIRRLDTRVRPFSDRARRADRGILDPSGQHAARRDAPDHRSGAVHAGMEVRSPGAGQRRQRGRQGGQLPGVGRRDAAPARSQDHARGIRASGDSSRRRLEFSPGARGVERAPRPEAWFGEPLRGADHGEARCPGGASGRHVLPRYLRLRQGRQRSCRARAGPQRDEKAARLRLGRSRPGSADDRSVRSAYPRLARRKGDRTRR